MAIFVQGLSALAHYRSASAKTDVERCPASVRQLSQASSSLREAIDLGIWRLGIGEPSAQRPLEVLVSNRRQRSGSKAIHPRVWHGEIAPTAFRTVCRDVYVSSPEFVFLQMATSLDLPELAALGMELCGTYRRNVEVAHLGSDDPSFTTCYNQKPLTTMRRLRGFCTSMKSAPGGRRAIKALEYVLPNSASPAETALYLLLCLPRHLGGYALPNPILNPPITLTKAGKRHTIRNGAKPDLYWKTVRLDLEYNSKEFHDENQRAADSMRRKALERMGVEVIELTKQELFSTRLFHATVLRIARRLKRRVRSEDEGEFSTRRSALRALLLADDSSNANLSSSEQVSADADHEVWTADTLYGGVWGDYYSDDDWDSVSIEMGMLDGEAQNENEGFSEWDDSAYDPDSEMMHVFGGASRKLDAG